MFGREKLELLFRAEASIAFFGAAVYEICDGDVLTNFLGVDKTWIGSSDRIIGPDHRIGSSDHGKITQGKKA